MGGAGKNKTFRHPDGCCICRAKSSTSRFTNSERYEHAFEEVFLTKDPRSEVICNACVLIIKRVWNMTTEDLAAKKAKELEKFGRVQMWSHMVDMKDGPGTKSAVKEKKRIHEEAARRQQERVNQKRKAELGEETEAPSDVEEALPAKKAKHHLLDCWDMNYWSRMKVCCGTILYGKNGEVFIIDQLHAPCGKPKRFTSGREASISPATSTGSVGNAVIKAQAKADRGCEF